MILWFRGWLYRPMLNVHTRFQFNILYMYVSIYMFQFSIVNNTRTNTD